MPHTRLIRCHRKFCGLRDGCFCDYSWLFLHKVLNVVGFWDYYSGNIAHNQHFTLGLIMTMHISLVTTPYLDYLLPLFTQNTHQQLLH
jgi:hypothetical protein